MAHQTIANPQLKQKPSIDCSTKRSGIGPNRPSKSQQLGLLLLTLAFVGLSGCMSEATSVAQEKPQEKTNNTDSQEGSKMEKATFGGGCFWCTEAVFESVEGVSNVVSGYAGGDVENPTYKHICTGSTGHAEVIQIEYDPKVVTFDRLLEIFWQTHDPTTLNRQGADVGTQYRSVVFYHNDEQQTITEKYKKKLNEMQAFDGLIVTEISPLEKFYPAEDYHQDYFAKNPTGGYCQAVIAPKLDKFKKAFADELKKEAKK